MVSLIGKNGKIEGFLVGRYYNRSHEAIRDMVQWIKEGKLKFEETIIEGIENIPQAFQVMMKGKNLGKVVVKV